MKRKSSVEIEELLQPKEETPKKIKTRKSEESEDLELIDLKESPKSKRKKSEEKDDLEWTDAEEFKKLKELEENEYSESTDEEEPPKRKSRKRSKVPEKPQKEKLKVNQPVQSVSISRKAILAAMRLLEQPKLKFDRRKREEDELTDNCYCRYRKEISYETKYYHMRHLKESILNRKWELLPDLLDLFMNSITMFEYKKYQPYFLELTHMVLQIHANFGSTDILKKFTSKFFVPLKQDKGLTPFDVWHFEE